MKNYFITWWTFFFECWCKGLLNCVPFTYKTKNGDRYTLSGPWILAVIKGLRALPSGARDVRCAYMIFCAPSIWKSWIRHWAGYTNTYKKLFRFNKKNEGRKCLDHTNPSMGNRCTVLLHDPDCHTSMAHVMDSAKGRLFLFFTYHASSVGQSC